MHSNSKKVISFILLAMILIVGVSFNGCSESPFKPVNPDPDPDPESSIIGTWVWQESCGGIAGVCIYADSVGYSRTWEFTEEYVVARRDDSVVFVSPYEIVRKPFWYWDDGDTVDVLVIDGWPAMKIETLNSDTLAVTEGCADCFGSVFVRELTVEPDPLGPLVGTWDWLKSCQGWKTDCDINEDFPYTISYTFENDYFLMRKNDSIVGGASYQIVSGDYVGLGNDVDVFFTDNQRIMGEMRIVGDTLILFRYCSHCYNNDIYVKRE